MIEKIILLIYVKYYGASFKIDKKYATELRERKQRFIEHTKTKKQVFTTFISNYGLFDNEYARDITDVEIVLDELFIWKI